MQKSVKADIILMYPGVMIKRIESYPGESNIEHYYSLNIKMHRYRNRAASIGRYIARETIRSVIKRKLSAGRYP